MGKVSFGPNGSTDLEPSLFKTLVHPHVITFCAASRTMQPCPLRSVSCSKII